LGRVDCVTLDVNLLVAKTKTQETAWELIELLKVACPHNEWVVVLRGPPGSGCEVVPLCAFHPDDREAAKQVVAEFAKKKA
jgi:hypothetical protein